MAMSPSPAVSARPSTGTVEELPWAVFLARHRRASRRGDITLAAAEVFRRLLATSLFRTS